MGHGPVTMKGFVLASLPLQNFPIIYVDFLRTFKETTIVTINRAHGIEVLVVLTQ